MSPGREPGFLTRFLTSLEDIGMMQGVFDSKSSPMMISKARRGCINKRK